MSDCLVRLADHIKGARLSLFVMLATVVVSNFSLVAGEIRVSCNNVMGTIRPLHGVNGGPINYGETIDLRAAWRELAVPITRLHDCEWPTPSVVDMHAVFPSWDADPAIPQSYQFARTDDYLKSIADTGAGFVYRLGESIEHSRRKYHVLPPPNYEKWTAVCIGIISHMNEGWAEGSHHNIRYWEIWNEPENRPAMWTGTDEQYYQLYSTASKGIKAKFPALSIGGPAVGATGDVVDGKFQPTAFLTGFLNHCRTTGAPLDFFSWHTYTDEPSLYALKAKAIRKWLDESGFKQTEIHLNEWNYLPGNDWSALSATGKAEDREKWYAEMGSENGAAFIANVLIDLQGSPVSVANLFTGDTGPFGLFSRYGVPKKTFYALNAFKQTLDTPHRLSVTGDLQGLSVLAGINHDKTEISILISNYRQQNKSAEVILEHLPWTGPSEAQTFIVDATLNLALTKTSTVNATSPRVSYQASGSSVTLIKLRNPGNSK